MEAVTLPRSQRALARAAARHEPAVPDRERQAATLLDDVRGACALLPPLWSQRNFVAVNPYLGWSDRGFGDALRGAARVFHVRGLMPAGYFQEQHRSGRIGREDLLEAAGRAPEVLARSELVGLPPEALVEELLAGSAPDAETEPRVLTLAEALDARDGTRWAERITESLSRWLAGRFDQGQAAWAQPGRDLPLYRAWREAARTDRSLELQGLRGFRASVARLPRKPLDAIAQVLDGLAIPGSARRELLARQLASLGGWAARLQREAFEAEAVGLHDASLEALLAMRLACDGALQAAFGGAELLLGNAAGLADAEGAEPGASAERLDDRERRLLWQEAFESAYRRKLLTRLSVGAPPRVHPEEAADRPPLQAVFCIDVRSEVLRRNLERQHEGIRTVGFAGFFGMPIELQHLGEEGRSARCPVLLQPTHALREEPPAKARSGKSVPLARERHRIFTRLRKLTVGTFPLVETLGLAFGPRLLSDALGWTHPRAGGALFEGPATEELAPSLEPDPERPGTGVPMQERIDLAEGALRNMGLTDGFARVVLLCGHGSSSSNNPYASALDCGACGGHSGEANARVACAILNDPAVRDGLRARGIAIPDDTRFVAGLHDTTTDGVSLFGDEELPAATRGRLRGWLERAGRATASERAPRLGESRGEALRRRATDWSELRPEWGLAGNAAFVAAPRALTRQLDLEGRCFLHDYDEDRDPEASVLELILTAPLVVASWINLQYYGSTVDNEVFGSGDKTIHNVSGRHGVMLGNGGDLRTGLPWQSVHDGTRFVHEPMRLTAVVRASRERIDAVLDAHEGLRNLVENGWIHLVAWDPRTGAFRQRGAARGDWRELEGADAGAAAA